MMTLWVGGGVYIFYTRAPRLLSGTAEGYLLPDSISQALTRDLNGQKEVVDFSLVFDGEDIQINADGKLWMSSTS